MLPKISTQRVSFRAAFIGRLAVLILVGQSLLSAGVIYTYVESLPAQFSGDLPTATWTIIQPNFLPSDSGEDFDGPPVLNAAALSDGFVWGGGFDDPDISTDDTDLNLSYIDPTEVVFTIGIGQYSPQLIESCQSGATQTTCIFPPAPGGLEIWTVSNGDNESSAQVDLVMAQSTQSTPEPGTWMTVLLGLAGIFYIRIGKVGHL